MNVATRPDIRATFSRFVDGEVLSAIGAGASDFAALLRCLPSVYPTELLTSIDRLAARREVSAPLAEAIGFEASRQRKNRPPGRSLLPVPHPLDFEWRFTPDTSRDLLDLATGLTPPNGDVMLFGTPSLAVEAMTLASTRRLSFLAEDNAVTQRLIVLNRSTGSPLSIACCSAGLPRAAADAVLIDPPWYMDFIRPMLEAAAAACRPGGVVLICLPPIGTRPSAEADRTATVRFASRLGLDLLEDQPLSIDYDTPFFEINALAAAGVHAPDRWRRGDLLVLRKSRKTSRSSPPVSGRRRTWVEVSIGRMRLFIRADSGDVTGNRGLIPLIEGDILPSVSRRDARRRWAQVWTSGNRVFGTDNPKLVHEAALSHAVDKDRSGIQPQLWGNLLERGALERVGQELLGLASIEAGEEHGSSPPASERRGLWGSSSAKLCSTLAATVSG